MLIQPNYDHQFHPNIEYCQTDYDEVKNLNTFTAKWADKMILSSEEDERVKILVNEYKIYRQDYEKILFKYNDKKIVSFRLIVKCDKTGQLVNKN